LFYSDPGNLYSLASLITADLTKANVTAVQVSKEEAASKSFKDHHITGKFPLLEIEDGTYLFESVAIAQHFVRSAPDCGLYGNSIF